MGSLKQKNLHRLLDLTIKQVPPTVRTVFDQAIQCNPLDKFVKDETNAIEELKKKCLIKTEEFEQLCQSPTPSSADLSTSLVLCLLRNLDCCGYRFNWNDKITEGDTTSKANFHLLHIFGNRLIDMSPSEGLDNCHFLKEQAEIAQILLHLSTPDEDPQADVSTSDDDDVENDLPVSQSGGNSLEQKIKQKQEELKLLFPNNDNTPGQATQQKPHVEPTKSLPQGEKQEAKYYETGGKTGLFVLLNDEKNREGSNIDTVKLLEFFKDTLKFDVCDMNDDSKKTVSEFLDHAKDTAIKNENRYYCIVFFIGCHGSGNNVSLKDSEVKFNDIKQLFNGKGLSKYRGRPKIFLTQFCRGTNTEGGGIATDDDITLTSTVLTGNDNADIFVIYSTVDGNVAYRYIKEKGTVFAGYCLETLNEDWCHHHLEKMMLTVRKKIADWEHKHTRDDKNGVLCRQTAVVESSLTKKFVFRRGLEKSE